MYFLGNMKSILIQISNWQITVSMQYRPLAQQIVTSSCRDTWAAVMPERWSWLTAQQGFAVRPEDKAE